MLPQQHDSSQIHEVLDWDSKLAHSLNELHLLVVGAQFEPIEEFIDSLDEVRGFVHKVEADLHPLLELAIVGDDLRLLEDAYNGNRVCKTEVSEQQDLVVLVELHLLLDEDGKIMLVYFLLFTLDEELMQKVWLATLPVGYRLHYNEQMDTNKRGFGVLG